MRRFIASVLFIIALATGFFGLVDSDGGTTNDRGCATAGPVEQYDINCEDSSWIDDEIRISEVNP